MTGSRRSTGTAGAPAVALLLASSLVAGCGASGSAQRVTTRAPVVAVVPATTTRSAQPSARSEVVLPPATAGDPSRRGPIPPAHPVPAAFRPAPGALTDAQVRSELQRLSAAERREREARLSPVAGNLASLLPWELEPKEGVSVASVFRDYGLGLACGGLLGRNQLGVAHKTAPCGTLITFTYAGRTLTVPVIDRGPYIAGREWDLTGATAEALGFPGLGEIQWRVAG
jgi:rare lipoprotein A (peptidoglycan hydrolase)